MSLLEKLFHPRSAADIDEMLSTARLAATDPNIDPANPKVTATPSGILSLGIDVIVRVNEPVQCDQAQIDGYLDGPLRARKLVLGRKGVMRGVSQLKEAEIRGDFDGELIVRGKLILHPSARVNGKIRFGEIVLWKGAQLTGDVKRIVKPNSKPNQTTESTTQLPPSHAPNTFGPLTSMSH